MGFTLLEIMAVIVLVGVLSATVALQLGTTSAVATVNQADQLRRNIVHIQLMAMNWGVALRLSMAGDGSGYSVTCLTSNPGTPCAATGLVPIDPATGEAFSVALTEGVVLAPAGNTIDFDSLGRPVTGSALITVNPARTYTLSGGGRTTTLTVLPITGFAEAS